MPTDPQRAPATGGRVIRAATIIMAAFILSRLLGLVREAVIGAQFALADEYGAYIAAFRLPDLLFNLVAGGALVSAFLPTFTDFLTSDDEEGSWQLASAVANWLMIVLGILSLLAALFAPWLVRNVIARGFPPEMMTLTADLMRIMLLSTIIFSLSGLVMGVLNAFEHFLMPALAPALYNVGILFGALVLAPVIGIHGLTYGVVLGAAAHLLIQLPMLRRYGARYRRTLGLAEPRIRVAVRQVVRLMGPRVLGAAMVQLMFLANTTIGSYYGPAVVAALNYAWIVMLLPHGIFASSVATAIFPTFSRMVAQGDEAGMQRGLARVLQVMFFVIFPSAVGLFVLREPIVRLLFDRGAWQPEATAAVAWALAFYSFGLVAHALIEITNRAFFALKDTLTPVLVGGAATAASIGLSLFLIPRVGDPASLVRGPQGALALANSLASTVEIFVIFWLLRRRLGGIAGRRLASGAVRSAGAALGMGLTLAALVARLSLTGSALYLLLPALILLGALLYLLLGWLLAIPEARALPPIVRARLRRR